MLLFTLNGILCALPEFSRRAMKGYGKMNLAILEHCSKAILLLVLIAVLSTDPALSQTGPANTGKGDEITGRAQLHYLFTGERDRSILLTAGRDEEAVEFLRLKSGSERETARFLEGLTKRIGGAGRECLEILSNARIMIFSTIRDLTTGKIAPEQQGMQAFLQENLGRNLDELAIRRAARLRELSVELRDMAAYAEEEAGRIEASSGNEISQLLGEVEEMIVNRGARAGKGKE